MMRGSREAADGTKSTTETPRHSAPKPEPKPSQEDFLVQVATAYDVIDHTGKFSKAPCAAW
jgi:hypothetical protein